MKKLIIGGLVLIAVIGIFSLRKPAKKTTPAPQTQGVSTTILESQSKSLGAVEIEVTPNKLDPNQSETIFSLSLNTHSVDLDYDYTQIVTLKDDLGNVYKPLQWTGGQSGHHLNGDLIFPALKNNPQNLELSFVGIDGQDISFYWNLKGGEKQI